MEDITAYKLNEIFKRWSDRQKIIQPEIMMTVTTENLSRIEVYPHTPLEAANYLRFFLKTEHPLMKPGVVRCDSPSKSAERPGSILFRATGSVRDMSQNMDWHKVLLHLKFTGTDNSVKGVLSLSEHFQDDVFEPLGHISGPTLNDFIRTLESAGREWKNITFKTVNSKMNTNQVPLQLINRKQA